MRRALTVIYLDSSVALAHVFAEPRTVSASFWDQQLISSRLLQYELWNRIHARGVLSVHDIARQVLGRVDFLDLDPSSLARALEPFPIAVRTLDSLHLASMYYLREQKIDLEFATFDRRMLTAAHALGIPQYDLLSPEPGAS